MNHLTELYQQLLPDLQKLEKVRKPYILARQLCIGFMILVLGVYFILPMFISLFLWLTGFKQQNILSVSTGFYSPFPYASTFLSFPAFFLFLVGMWAVSHYSAKIHDEQKKITLHLLKKINPALQLNHKIIEPKQLTQSGFFNRGDRGNKVYPISSGVIEGEIEGVPVEFAEINIMETKLPWYGFIPLAGTFVMLSWQYFTYLKNFFGKRRDMVMYGFRGLFFMAEFNKNINGMTIVLPDAYEKHFGFLTRSVQELMRKKQGQLAYLEDPRFEKEFMVYTTDQVEARYILSTNLMEKIVQLKKKIQRPLLLSFRENKIYIAIPDPEGVFQLPLRTTVLTPTALEKPYNDLVACADIVRELKLNRRIWG